MKPYLVVHPAAGTLYAITLVGWALIELHQSVQRREGATQLDPGTRGAGRLIYGAVAILAVSLVVSALTIVPAAVIRPSVVAFAIGMVILWAGLGLRFCAFKTLGASVPSRHSASTSRSKS
jgi:hypothetical protein